MQNRDHETNSNKQVLRMTVNYIHIHVNQMHAVTKAVYKVTSHENDSLYL